jgi:uncharacterized protein (TIGR00251 family)
VPLEAVTTIQPTADGVEFAVRVIPRSGRSGLAGVRGDAILVRLLAPPVDGAANDELIRIIAAAFHVPRRAVTLAAGDRSRTKRVRVVGVSPLEASSRLLDRTS